MKFSVKKKEKRGHSLNGIIIEERGPEIRLPN